MQIFITVSLQDKYLSGRKGKYREEKAVRTGVTWMIYYLVSMQSYPFF